MENTGRDAFANTPFFTDSFSLANSFLVDSAPQDQCVRAPVDPARHLLYQRRHPQIIANASTRI